MENIDAVMVILYYPNSEVEKRISQFRQAGIKINTINMQKAIMVRIDLFDTKLEPGVANIIDFCRREAMSGQIFGLLGGFQYRDEKYTDSFTIWYNHAIPKNGEWYIDENIGGKRFIVNHEHVPNIIKQKHAKEYKFKLSLSYDGKSKSCYGTVTIFEPYYSRILIDKGYLRPYGLELVLKTVDLGIIQKEIMSRYEKRGYVVSHISVE